PASGVPRYAEDRKATMNNAMNRTAIGDIVATDFRAAGVFEEFGIDFCCGGRRSFVDACREAAVDPEAVRRALDALPADQPADAGDVRQWPIERLVDHVVATHHTYVRVAMPSIAHHLEKLIAVHGERHPELARIANAFDELGRELQQHMLKEEHVLF